MTAEQKLLELLGKIPAAPAPVGAYVAAVRTGNLVFTSGQLPFGDGKLMHTGKVPTSLTLADAQACARQAAINALLQVRAVVGSLDMVTRVVRLNIFVNSAQGFTQQAAVANGASELLVEVLGEAGRHTRCGIGAAELPLDAPVEVDLVVEVKP